MGIWNLEERFGLEIQIWELMVVEGMRVGVISQVECKRKGKKLIFKDRILGDKLVGREKEQVIEVKRNGLRVRKRIKGEMFWKNRIL